MLIAQAKHLSPTLTTGTCAQCGERAAARQVVMVDETTGQWWHFQQDDSCRLRWLHTQETAGTDTA